MTNCERNWYFLGHNSLTVSVLWKCFAFGSQNRVVPGRRVVPSRAFTRQLGLPWRYGNPSRLVNASSWKQEEMCECQGNPLARVTLPPCKQGLSFPVTFILSISLLIHLPGKNPIKRVQSSQGLTTLLYSVYCTVERDWSDGLRDDRVSNHGIFFVFFAVGQMHTFRSTECG